jgi:glycosyltransferase involved in cell wall biosynthesis
MTITLYTFCYNEQEMLPYFLNHYSKIVDKIVVYNNESTDSSIDILNSFKGCEIEIRDYITNNEYQEESLIKLKNNCWKNEESDYVIVLDIDEILYHPNLREFLESNPDYDYFKPMGYDMVGDSVPTDYTKQIYEIIINGAPSTNFCKKALFKRKFVNETNFSYGAHDANYKGKRALNEYISNGDLKLLHYKCIDLEYVITKNKNYSKRRSEYSKKFGLGLHYDFSEKKFTEIYYNLKKNSKQII